MKRHSFSLVVLIGSILIISVRSHQLDYGLSSSLNLQDFIGPIDRKQTILDSQSVLPENILFDTNENYRIRKDDSNEPISRYHFQTRDDILLPREPSPRKEYLEHSSLYGHQYMQGGAGEGTQHLKPDGSISNMQVIKSDSVLPAYCNPPNPCPIGYTAEDGCLDDFVNSAGFSKEYQASQECMCDTEHMFSCPGNTDENELETLARSIQNEGLMDNTIDKIMENMQTGDEPTVQHKVVAKKFFTKRSGGKNRSISKRSIPELMRSYNSPVKMHKMNPFLNGERLPVVAKKSPHLAKN